MPPRSNGFILPCIPARALKPPAGPGWVYEIKHDGYRLQVRRDGDAVRLFTRRGYDWSGRCPAIVVTAMQLRATSFWRGSGVRPGRRRDLRCSAPPWHRQRGDAVRVRPAGARRCGRPRAASSRPQEVPKEAARRGLPKP
jgi:hypothetical protein